jgi:hypothetical protein
MSFITWIYPLRSLHHDSIKGALSQWKVVAGSFSKCLYTDFDPKILDDPSGCFLRDINVMLCGAPSGHQNQNSLVKCAWQTITNMACSFITDMQMPHSFLYWGLRQSVRISNYIPCTVENISTTPHKLVYGIKPDLQVLFACSLLVSLDIFAMVLIIKAESLNPMYARHLLVIAGSQMV